MARLRATQEPEERRSIPAWPWVAGTVLCVLGLAVAVYLTWAHFDASVQLACPETGIINCERVTQSSYSELFGIFPVAVLGLAFFVFMLPLQLPWAWRSTNRWIRAVRMASCVVGVAFVLWLLYAELIRIRHICLYCTSVHVLTLAVFLTTAFGTIATSPFGAEEPDGPRPPGGEQ